jgi:hypothetical protein
MFEAVGFKLFNLAGVEGPHTHWIHFRIVDEAEETTSDQFGGDFWGLYLVTEDMEDDFLKEHDLPPGNLYKMEFGDPVLQTKSSHARSGDPDVRLFLGGYRTNRAEKWWQENVDLPRYYSYRSIVECIHHYDIYAGKNYFYYHHPVTGQWSVHPWDIDLTWADNMHGSGEEPFFRAGLLRRSPFDRGYQNRLREIRDLLFNPEQTGALIAAYAALISSPELEDSFVEADRRRWDYHPIMASRYVHPRKAGQGLFYAITPQKSFSGMLELMNRYVRRRGAWVDAALLRGSVVPPQPRVERNDSLSGAAAGVGFRATLPEGSKPTPTYQWRLGQTSVTQPHLKETQFEIVALWQTNSGAQVRIPRDLIRAGETYRVRARAQDASGYCGPWSEAVEVTGGK